MRHCYFSEILLLSFIEKRAKRIRLDRDITIVLGANDTGKSSLLKSIYSTFGAEPAKTHQSWASAKVVSLVRFSLEANEYTILRRDSLYAIFDASGTLLNTFTKITSGLGPYLSDLFDFGVKLSDREGKTVTPPPAYFFLPFYIDQDISWASNWSGFAKLGQIPGWRDPIIEYHTGIRPNEYYKIKGDLEARKTRQAQLEAEIKSLQTARDRLEQELPADTFDIDIDSFKAQVEELIGLAQRLRTLEEKYKVERVHLANMKIAIVDQIHITEAALRELSEDYQFASEELVNEAIECPTCGASYDNSFVERFSIARDEDRCRELLLQLREDLAKTETDIQKLTSHISKNRDEIMKIEHVLAEKRGALQLRDIIESEGRKEVRRVFSEGLNSYYRDAREVELEIIRLQGQLKLIEDKDRKEEILEYYLSHMRRYLHELDVRTMPEKTYRKISAQVRETGSDLPRALLAYYYSILHTVEKYSSAVFCPIVIDSPNQQAQDPSSLRKMLGFILKNRPQGSQLILGLENLLDLEPEAMVIELHDKHRLLNDEDFPSVAKDIQVFLDKVLFVRE